jgi:hypothetical protein
MREMEKNILLQVVKEFLVLFYKVPFLDTVREF